MAEVTGDLEYLQSLTENPRILEFGAFLIAEREDRRYPSFSLQSLMSVPRLAPNIFAYDFRKGIEAGMLVAHAGTKIDYEYGYNVTGTTLEDHYPGDDSKDDVLAGYRRVFKEGKKFYSHRTIRMQKDEWSQFRVAESLMFPCSTNQSDIDFGWGMVLFDPAEATVENVYYLW